MPRFVAHQGSTTGRAVALERTLRRITPRVVKDALRPLYARVFPARVAPPALTAPPSKFLTLLKERRQFGDPDAIADPTKRMWVDFALSTNARGRAATADIERSTRIHGKRYLDVGCAYGGFLLAFGEKGASRVVGIDINTDLLGLAAANLEDAGISATLYQRDLLDPEVLELGPFDIITCNDVIEHVEDPRKAIDHLARLLAEGGVLYMAIPNRYAVGFIKEDGHYKLPGITLLPRQRAARYHALNFGDGYGVGYYRKLDYYLGHLVRHGLFPALLHQEVGALDPDQIDGMFQDALRSLQDIGEKRLEPALAAEIRAKGRRVYTIFARDAEVYRQLRRRSPERAMDLARRIHRRYGADFWTLIAVKQTPVEPLAGLTTSHQAKETG